MAYSKEVEKILLQKCYSIEKIENLSDYEKTRLENGIVGNRLYDNNRFLGKTREVKFFTFNLPRILTCPGRTNICKKYCYQGVPENAMKADGRESAVVYHRRMNWFFSTHKDFVKKMIEEINRKRPRKFTIIENNNKIEKEQEIIIRIHASGDFYSDEYLMKWMQIALRTKLKGKKYKFVAYTKSFSLLDNVLKDQEKLQTIYKMAYDAEKKEPEAKDNLSLSDFNLKIIASYMDDTEESDKKLAEKWNLPVYFVTKEKRNDLVDCTSKSCAECHACYKETMKEIKTELRVPNQKKKRIL